jgi:cytochrome c-type biogenesis protein CcsB
MNFIVNLYNLLPGGHDPTFRMFWLAVIGYVISMALFFGYWAFKKRIFLKIAFPLMTVAWLLHGAEEWWGSIPYGRPPVGDMYEYLSTLSWIIVGVFLFLAWRYRAYVLGGPMLLASVTIMAIGAIFFVPPGPLIPALQSYWIAIHVTSMVTATALFTCGIIFGVLAQIKSRKDKGSKVIVQSDGNYVERIVPGGASQGEAVCLAPSSALEELSHKFVMFATPIWFFGIMAGSMWAEEAWHSWWSWDPKETTALITGIVYAIYLHARNNMKVTGKVAFGLQVLGFCCMLFTLIAVNIWITGLHSYAT